MTMPKCTATWGDERCTREAVTGRGDLCSAHYQQRHSGKPFKKPRNRPGRYGRDCHFIGCSNRAAAVGLCHSHYKMMETRGILEPLYLTQRPRGGAVNYDRFGRKECARCKGFLPPDDFGFSYRTEDRKAGTCNPCRRAREGSEDKLILMKANRYGVDPEWIYAEFDRLGGKCPGCSDDFGGVTKVHIDHDHSCCGNAYGACGKCVRGLLCRSCNTGLGMLRDNKETLVRLHKYLTDYEEETN